MYTTLYVLYEVIAVTSLFGKDGIDMLILTCAVLIKLITTNWKSVELPSDEDIQGELEEDRVHS
jgi:hypothetical protein